jgi:hypothetical protein
VLLVPMLVALVGGVGACSDATNGSPVAGGTTTDNEPTTGRTTPRTPTTTSKSGSGASPIKDTDPCSLLTAQGQSQLGVSDGQKSQVGSGRKCQWRMRGPSDTTFFSVIIYDNLGIKDLPPDLNPKALPDVGSHKAVQDTDSNNPGNCAVIMDVTESSRVSASVLIGTDTNKACDLAMQLAQLVEPELP